MPRKRNDSKPTTSLRVGDISDVSGTVNIAGGNITTHQTSSGPSAAEIRQIFDGLYQELERRADLPSADKADLKTDVQEIQTAVTEAVQSDKKVDEGFLSRRFRNMARMAPDLLDVVVATLTNPLAGLGVAVKKIAERAKEETGSVS